ncbi:hypothetical protein ACHAW6_010939 [Cyclotella cf. meneghiniana]
MMDKLQEIRLQQSCIDKCVFYQDDAIFFVYMDDRLIQDITSMTKDIQLTTLEATLETHAMVLMNSLKVS